MTATTGSTGCLQLNTLTRKHKLWYIELRNALNSVAVDLRVYRNQSIVHEDRYELDGVESYENPNNVARYVADVPYVRFRKPTWDTDLAQFALEYKLAHQTEWNRESFDDIETQNIGATISVGSRNHDAEIRVHEHESEADAQEIIEYVENERENYSNGTST
jgi:hypothetical protein